MILWDGIGADGPGGTQERMRSLLNTKRSAQPFVFGKGCFASLKVFFDEHRCGGVAGFGGFGLVSIIAGNDDGGLCFGGQPSNAEPHGV